MGTVRQIENQSLFFSLFWFLFGGICEFHVFNMKRHSIYTNLTNTAKQESKVILE